jgi:hypothetical protein
LKPPKGKILFRESAGLLCPEGNIRIFSIFIIPFFNFAFNLNKNEDKNCREAF